MKLIAEEDGGAEARPQCDTVEAGVIAAASAGDDDAFRRLTEPYVRELHLHCYRLLGSFHDAEDALQETLLRGWRHLDSYRGRSSFRAWLYRIATNECMRLRRRRPLDRSAVPDAIETLAPAMTHSFNLSPYPDTLLEELETPFGNPGAEYDLYESVQLAFVAVVQLLPPRQRAALLLHDVVGFPAAEVADLLDSTVASVNSGLNRARATIQQHRSTGHLGKRRSAPPDQVTTSLVARWITAWQAADVAQLSDLLKADVVMGVPALGLQLNGRSAVCQFLANVPPREQRDKFRFIPTRANRQPALAAYRLDPDDQTNAYRGWGVVVLRTDGCVVAGIVFFPEPNLMRVFGLPSQL